MEYFGFDRDKTRQNKKVRVDELPILASLSDIMGPWWQVCYRVIPAPAAIGLHNWALQGPLEWRK